jgi:DNA-binding MarR family transcriptional regulator
MDELARELESVLHQLGKISNRVRRNATDVASLPPSELEVIRLVTSEPGLRVADVAERLAMQASNVSAAVRQLAAQGLIERREDERDGRVTRLHPTPQADANRRKLSVASTRYLRTGLARLDADELIRLQHAVPALTFLARELGDGLRGGPR